MRNSLLRMFFIVIMAATLITGTLSYIVAQNAYEQQLDKSVVENIDLFCASWNTSGLEKASADFTKTINGLRISIILPDGTVRYDTDTAAEALDNHKSRPEIEQALNSGVGISKRTSKTTLIKYKYVAKKLTMDGEECIVRLCVPMDNMKGINKNIFLLVFLGITTGVGIALLFAVRYSSEVTTPLKKLSEATTKIAGGEYIQKFDFKTKYEVAELSRIIIQMGQSLDRSITLLHNRNEQLKTIIDNMVSGLLAIDNEDKIILINQKAVEMLNLPEKDPKGMELFSIFRNGQFTDFVTKSVKDSIDFEYLDRYFRIKKSKITDGEGTVVLINDITQVKKLEDMRSEFVANVTHELKTPLTSIKGFTDTLKNGAIENKDAALRFLEIIEIESDRLIRLINDILDLSDIENMAVESQTEDVIIDDVIVEVISLEKNYAAEKDVTISYHNNGAVVSYRANRDRFKQLLLNLVSNGVRYNRENGEVDICADEVNRKLRIRVKDTGIGIPEDKMPRLFERFYRVDKSRSTRSGGTGLGLSIVKHIVNIYNGEIYVSSEPDKGSEFTIFLPIAEGKNESTI